MSILFYLLETHSWVDLFTSIEVGYISAVTSLTFIASAGLPGQSLLLCNPMLD